MITDAERRSLETMLVTQKEECGWSIHKTTQESIQVYRK
jgi:hypothetical protein